MVLPKSAVQSFRILDWKQASRHGLYTVYSCDFQSSPGDDFRVQGAKIRRTVFWGRKRIERRRIKLKNYANHRKLNYVTSICLYLNVKYRILIKKIHECQKQKVCIF